MPRLKNTYLLTYLLTYLSTVLKYMHVKYIVHVSNMVTDMYVQCKSKT